MNYPTTPMRKVTDVIHGQSIDDDYRWLEDDENPEVLEWSKAQNYLVERDIKQTVEYKQYHDELTRLLAIDSQSSPVLRNGRYFYTTQGADQDHGVAVYREGLEGAPRVIIDPNKLQQELGKPVGLSFWSASPSARYVVYGLIIAGKEMSELVVMELASMKEVARLPYHRSGAVWLPDETGFYHVQYPTPGSVPKGEETYHMRVNFFSLSTSRDREIYGQGTHKETSFVVRVSPDGALVSVSSSRGWRSNEIYLATTANHEFAPLITGIEAKFTLLMLRDRMLIATDYQAPNRRVLSAKFDNMPQSIDDWAEIIPETEANLVGTSVTSTRIVLHYVENVSSRLVMTDYEGSFITELNLPPLSSVNAVTAHRSEDEFFYSYSNFLASNTINRFNPEIGNGELYRPPVRQLDAARIGVTQEWFESSDGTKVPMFVIARLDIKHESTNKTLLFGYGGFGINQTPGFPTLWVPFIEAGGVYAIANIRGGAEFGKAWHEGGVREHKQQSFDDFIAAAEYLISSKRTSPAHLAIAGGSNGGLLVGACLTQRPELFGAVVCKVPLLDMVRFPKFLMASRWTEEYGNPEVKADFDRIVTWSPYHNISSAVKYPALLITTGVNDTRVAPLHARKFAAAMQALKQDAPVYLWTDMDKGHGPGQGRSQFAEAQAMVLTFLDRHLV